MSIESDRKLNNLDSRAFAKDHKEVLLQPRPLSLDQQRGRIGGPYKTMQELGFPPAVTVSPPARIGSNPVVREIMK